MHVLQLGPYPPPEGGVSRNMLAIRDELQRGGDKCSIIAIGRSGAKRGEPDVFHPESPFEVIKLLRTIKFDVLHLHVGGDISRRILGLAYAATKAAGKRSVLTIHSGAFPLTRAARRASPISLGGLIFRRFGRIIAVNDELAGVFMRYSVERDRIRKILPFALSLPDKTVEIPLHISQFLQRHAPVLLAVGGLERDYDPLFQIGAMAAIRERLPEAGLVIVGDGSMRGEVEAAVDASGQKDHVMVAGNIDHAVTLNLIDQADILLRTTLFDGDAISVREALFLGTPVIATDNGMRPAGTRLIAIGDESGFIDLVAELAPKGKQSKPDRVFENGNIDAVISLYRELL